MMRLRLIAITGACSLVLAACGGGGQEAPQMPPPDVGVVTVQAGDALVQREFGGRLSAVRSSDVRARVSGVLQRRVYAEGSDVSEGDVLFVIDPAPYQAELAAARAAAAQAQANQVNARANAERARRLAPSQFISQADVDNALATERSADAALQAAQAAVQTAQINLGYATVRAPISGRASRQQVTEGALVGQGEATLLTTIDQLDELYANFSISLTELAQIRRELTSADDDQVKVDVVLPDGTLYPHPGVLDFAGNLVDPASGAVAMRALLPNPEGVLFPGAYVTLKVTMGVQGGVFMIPQQAIQRDAAGSYVLVVDAEGIVQRKDVRTGRTQGTDWIVESGIEAGDQVIVSGIQRVQPGAPANPSPWSADAADAQDPSAQPEPAPEASPDAGNGG